MPGQTGTRRRMGGAYKIVAPAEKGNAEEHRQVCIVQRGKRTHEKGFGQDIY